MPLSARANPLRRRTLQRVCIGAALVAAGATAATIQTGGQTAALASADDPDADASASAVQQLPHGPRHADITPASPLEVDADPDPIDVLTTALAARFELVAAATPPPEPEPEPTQPAESPSEPASSEAPSSAPEPEPEPEPSSDGAVSTTNVPLETWEAVARCESGYGGEPDWSINTGNGYYGGLQFALSSWEWVGGTGYPHEASKATQIEMAERLWERQGWNAWPACSRQLGLR